MKKILFVCSHLYSGSSVLCDALNKCSTIQKYKLSLFNSYSSPLNLLNLTYQPHKLSNRSAVYMEELLYNSDLCTYAAYKECRFIYVVREPEPVLGFLIKKDKIKPNFAVRYYRYRLRRLYEMTRKTPGSILLTWDDLVQNRGMDLIQEYLDLDKNLDINLNSLVSDFSSNLNLSIKTECENSYQKYLYLMKNQNIIFSK